MLELRHERKYQLYLPKATLEAVSDRSVKKEKNCSTLQGLKSMVYFRHLKVAKNRYFLGVGETSQGKTPTPKRPKDVSWEKSICESSLI